MGQQSPSANAQNYRFEAVEIKEPNFRIDDWYGVLLFHFRSLEPDNPYIYRALLESTQVQRIYLDELDNPKDQTTGIRLIQLTLDPNAEMVEQGKQLIAQTNQGQTENLSSQDIIEVVAAIAIYKLTILDRSEVEAMLGINLEESRIYQEIKVEGKLKSKLQLGGKGSEATVGEFIRERTRRTVSRQIREKV